jgi:hypothetical protein
VAHIARLFLIVPGLALVLAACGSVHAGAAPQDAAPHAAASPAATTAPAGATWRTFPAGDNAKTVHLAGSGRVLLIPVQAPFGDRARVHQVAPQFPTGLCASLLAVGPYARNQG